MDYLFYKFTSIQFGGIEHRTKHSMSLLLRSRNRHKIKTEIKIICKYFDSKILLKWNNIKQM